MNFEHNNVISGTEINNSGLDIKMKESDIEMKRVKDKNTELLNKKDRDGVFWRWFFTCSFSYNYETQQSGGVVHALGPALRKIYKNDEQYKNAIMSYYSIFNTHKYMGNAILGACLAIEEKHKENGEEGTRETAMAVKTALMGPLAGVGDALFSSIPMTLFGAIAAYMALEGSILGVLLGVLFGIGMIFVRKKLFNLGYVQGIKILENFSGSIGNMINAVSVMGLMVVGALISTTVKLSTSLVFSRGDVVMEIQPILDNIMPNILPVALVALVYWLLGKKKMTVGKIILFLLLVAFVGHTLHIFA